MPDGGTVDQIENVILETARALAEELGGVRAANAVEPNSSLERQVGLGSLERVELLLRLERRFGHALNDQLLTLDTPAELARAVAAAGGAPPAQAVERGAIGPATPMRVAVPTIHAALWHRAELTPERPHVFVRDTDGIEQVVTYGQLLSNARAVAGGLRDRGVNRGDTVALMLPTSVEFLYAFHGILIAGAIPVPIYPPVRLDHLDEYARRQSAILRNAAVRLMITIPRATIIASILRSSVPSLTAVTIVEELVSRGVPWTTLDGAGGNPAFIQYTSGSTGHPKGVLLTHDNLLANIKVMTAGLDLQPDDVGVSWLPLYHDMGLIGTWLFSLVNGIPLELQSPLYFLARPERWLRTIHERRATLGAAPNFAFELCINRIADEALEGLDLSSWRCLLNGAEPISASTLTRFQERFGPYGFRPGTMMTVYGLAESSVALCFPPVGRPPRIDSVRREAFERDGRAEVAAEGEAALQFVSVGTALPGHEIRLIDAAGADVPERRVGRLIFRGPSAMPGYYRQPEATAAIEIDGFYDTGDLAYMADGEIYIAGRSKDLIIKEGRNLVPQEIEEVTAAVHGIRRGCVVAFGIEDQERGTEKIVVVAETRAQDATKLRAMESAVVAAVTDAIGLPPDVVMLVPPGAVPKTSSGKIRRLATRDLYLQGTLGRTPRLSLAIMLRLGRAALGETGRRAWRAVVRAAYAVRVVVVAAPIVSTAWLLVALIPSAALARALQRGGARLVLRIAGCRLSVTGGERLKGGGPFLLACNHCSYSDIFATLALVPADFAFVAKEEVIRWPFIGWFVRRAGHLTVDRLDAFDSLAAVRKTVEAVKSNRSVLVFPEATFTENAGLRPFRLGIFKIAAETGMPVVPMALEGTRRVLRPGTHVPKPGPIKLWIGEPIAPAGNDWRSMVELRDQVAGAIAEHCGEPRTNLIAGGYQPDAV
ncbi:MAG TPA: AMP-binding protein [Thermoanaerobaculia bacterium]|nr:AMP-binding protein [Thermoanaerobaculia bacterium]